MSAEFLIWLFGMIVALVGTLMVALNVEPVEMRYSEDNEPRIEAYIPESKEEAEKLNKKIVVRRCIRNFGIVFVIFGFMVQITHFFLTQFNSIHLL